jgi:tetratricopeptide (TPR) repeat protein
MRSRSGLIFALTVGLGLGGCAAGAAGGGGGGPLTSPTGRVYEPGIRPTQTRTSQQATLALAQGQYDVALAQAREGIAADSTNPIHFYVAGDAAVGLGDYELADSMWAVAERIFPAYELEIEPSREAAWASAFNEGVEAYNAGDMTVAREAWERADLIYRFRPEAAQNLAILLQNEGEYEAAIAMYRRGIESIDLVPATRVMEEAELAERAETKLFMQQSLAQLLLFTDQFAEAEPLLRELVQLNPEDIESQASLATALTRLGREDEATEIYSRLLSSQNLPPSELFSIGVALYQAEDYVRAAEAFERVTRLQPNSRDAWYNQANAMLQSERWADLAPVAQRLVQIDPLNVNAALILTQAYRETGQNQQALEALQRIEEVPLTLEGLQMQPGTQRTVLNGQVTGQAAAAGTPVQLRFTFYDDDGEVGSSTVTINAPAPDTSAEFEVTVDQQANAYKYELVM